MKWWHWLLFILLFIIGLFLFGNSKSDKKIIGWLNRLKKKEKDEIQKANARIKKRKKLYKAVKEKRFEVDKNIKSMSDAELDKYINAYL